MKFALSQIRKNAYDEPFEFSGDVDVSELESLNNDIRKTSPANVVGNCVIEGDEFIFTLMIHGELILPCARTLVDVNYEYSIHTIEVFSASPHYGKEEEENDIHPIESEIIDLTELIKENIILNLPYRVYSPNKEDLADAVTDGKGWNLATEDEWNTKEEVTEEEAPIDPRLKKLQSLLDDDDNNN